MRPPIIAVVANLSGFVDQQVGGEWVVLCKRQACACSSICASGGHMSSLLAQMELRARTHLLLPWPSLGTPERWDIFHALCIHLPLREAGETSEMYWDLLRI